MSIPDQSPLSRSLFIGGGGLGFLLVVDLEGPGEFLERSPNALSSVADSSSSKSSV